MLRAADPASLPRIVYMYWDRGLDNAPEICRFCRDSWHRLNPGWQIVELDRASATDILDPSDLPSDIEPCHYADLLRLELLSRTGGVWADATLLCLKPLDEWLPMNLAQADAFVFSNPAPDRLISNWFIAALDQSEVIQRWKAASMGYWRGRRRPPRNYFWQHALWQRLVLLDRNFRAHYRSMPRLSADTCQRMLYGLRRGHFSDRDYNLIAISPLQKLSHKDDIAPTHVEKVLRHVRATKVACTK